MARKSAGTEKRNGWEGSGGSMGQGLAHIFTISGLPPKDGGKEATEGC